MNDSDFMEVTVENKDVLLQVSIEQEHSELDKLRSRNTLNMQRDELAQFFEELRKNLENHQTIP